MHLDPSLISMHKLIFIYFSKFEQLPIILSVKRKEVLLHVGHFAEGIAIWIDQ